MDENGQNVHYAARVITCPQCKAKNRVVPHSNNVRPVCGKCQSPLLEPIPVRVSRIARTLSGRWRGGLLAVFSALVIIAWYLYQDQNQPDASPPEESLTNFNEPAQEIPASGTVWRYFQGEGIAPLEIVTKAGEGNYYLKLTDWQSKTPVMFIFVRGGDTVEVNVPLGSYRIKYVTGSTWYGQNFLFGPRTVYNEAQAKFDFTFDGTNPCGYTIKLIPQIFGNLETKRISKSKW